MSTVGATNAVNPQQMLRLRQQAEEMEGVFLTMLTKQMFSGIDTDESAMGGGFSEETWRSMQAEELANTIARNGGLGIAEQLLPDLLAMQEANNNNNQNKIMPIAGAYK